MQPRERSSYSGRPRLATVTQAESVSISRLRLLALLILTVTSVQVALAEPKAITQAKSQAAALQARLNQLNTQAELLVEKYDKANMQLDQTKAAAAENAAKLKQAQQQETTAESSLSARLVKIYEQGNTGTLDVLLSASSWSDLLNRLGLLERISAQDKALVTQVEAYRGQVADQQAKLAQEAKQEQVAAAQVQSDKKAVQAKLAANQQALKGDQQQIAQMEKAWQAQQAKLAAEARAAAAQAALKAQAGASSGPAGGNASGSVCFRR